ncbi:MAG: hypothetical protein KAI29_24500 [Cyclobacteriaceae bacterium]|nr:hypothetical protein [Cyclobacteriaceae bacterium]
MTKCKFEGRCPFIDLNQKVNHAPILVRNPYTNDLINVQLFFDLLHKHYNDDPRKYAKKIDEEIRLLVEFMPSEEEALIPIKNAIDQMFDRRNVEFEILVPEEVQAKIDRMIIEIKGSE